MKITTTYSRPKPEQIRQQSESMIHHGKNSDKFRCFVRSQGSGVQSVVHIDGFVSPLEMRKIRWEFKVEERLRVSEKLLEPFTDVFCVGESDVEIDGVVSGVVERMETAKGKHVKSEL